MKPALLNHTVEKIGGTSMSAYEAVKNNIFKPSSNDKPEHGRIFVVSAYGGITDLLLEHKKTGEAGVYEIFKKGRDEEDWTQTLDTVRSRMLQLNAQMYDAQVLRDEADEFINQRIDQAHALLGNLYELCSHGHFSIKSHLETVREMLASIGEAHSAFNLTKLLSAEGIDAEFIDLTGWKAKEQMTLDERILKAFEGKSFDGRVYIVTGYAHCKSGLMKVFDRGYSEITFSRIAVLTKAREAIIHKEFHLSSADPRLVGEEAAVPIGRTNYDVADQLANLGMEAIHPKAAQGLRQAGIALRVKNTFEPEHSGTLITEEYVSASPQVEIIAGLPKLYLVELFNQEMTGKMNHYGIEASKLLASQNLECVAKDSNANTISFYLDTNQLACQQFSDSLKREFPMAEINTKEVSLVSAIGSDMNVPGLLATTVTALAKQEINIIALHQTARQVDMQFVIDTHNYDAATKALHAELVEIHNHGRAICLAS